MIVVIAEQSTLSAVKVYLEPSTPPDERKADLACLIAIPSYDKHFDAKLRTWTITHPMRYTKSIPDLKPYLRRMTAKNAKPFTEQ